MRKTIFVFTFFVLFFALSAHARLVTSDNDLRTTYEKLISCRVIEKPFYGQRSWTEQAIRAQLSQLNSDLVSNSPCDTKDVQALIEQLKNQLADHLGRTKQNWKFHNIEWGNTYVSGGTTAYPANNSGPIAANKNPLLENQRNQLLGEGHNTLLTTEVSLFLKNHEIFLRPQAGFLLTGDDANSTQGRATLEQAYASLNGDWLQVIAGRAPVLMGQSEYGGLMFSENARPLDHLLVTNTKPISLPWVFKHLGEIKSSLLFGTLGPDQDHPWDFFASLSLGLKPHQNLEFNLLHIIQFGGENSTPITAGQWLQEFFGFIPGISQSTNGGTNKITGINGRFFLDRFMGTQVYADFVVEDSVSGSWTRIKRLFTDKSSYQLGLYSTRFLGSLSDSLRIEGTLTAPIAFRHSEFANGWTINNKIIGDSLGPDGARVLLSWSHDWEHLGKPWETTLSGWWEMTDNNSYAYPAAYNGTTTITDLGPNENRWVFDLQHQFRWENWSLKADLAYLHTVNADRVGGKTDSNVRVGALVEIPLY